ncbi:hypothetical protein AcV5_000539 [Taiwanofungus camphoratus]|nr:hypothetical protein AcV5_000539 [Antrodia cinnamomea]
MTVVEDDARFQMTNADVVMYFPSPAEFKRTFSSPHSTDPGTPLLPPPPPPIRSLPVHGNPPASPIF